MKRIIFMNENDDSRSNIGCQNGSEQAVRVFIELFNSEVSRSRSRPWTCAAVEQPDQQGVPGVRAD